jgi:hypothetical protein
MNERIRELINEATSFKEGLIEGKHDIELFDKEKFAELIVKECGLWFNDRLVVEPDYGLEHRVERNRAVVGVMKEFNQHFGVEE